MAKSISPYSYGHYTKALNQYIDFLAEYNYIGKDDCFTIYIEVKLEQKKRGLAKPRRSQETYNEVELIEIKNKIDLTYTQNPKLKLRAYALYFFVCIGQRRGNALGLRAENLYPQADPPHFELKDNIVKSWSRSGPGNGVIVLENCTKTKFFGDNEVKIPLLQPSVGIVVEVAEFLKQNLDPKDRLLQCHPDSVYRFWKNIAADCGFRFLSPHDWKHSYATIGSNHFHDWYMGNPHWMQVCCQHESIRMTMSYVRTEAEEFLSHFKKK